ncbi:Uncharacterized protein dnm_015090 [Desulfonema magnum]|uniref:Uncharacterized protein n=1 Tax=Desulfonema magnum TaxID=45655 RepID=A0A975GM59_9BACT|nr:Uncharacterized protein dnm_015090 [Desulfonema magnum]
MQDYLKNNNKKLPIMNIRRNFLNKKKDGIHAAGPVCYRVLRPMLTGVLLSV